MSIQWKSVTLGWLVAILAGLLVSLPLRGLYDVLAGATVTPGKFTSGLVTVSLVSGFFAYLLGGYVAGKLAGHAGGLNGAMTAVLGAVTGVILSAFGIAIYGGVLVALVGLEPGEVAVLIAVTLFLVDIFGGYVGGTLGEPSEPGVRRLDD